MTEAELLALRTVLANRRGALLDQLAVALLDRLAITAEDGNLPTGQVIELGFLRHRLAVTEAGPDSSIDPGFLRLLADLHTTITAVDAALAESITAGDEP
jgi:hypothetical protein